MNNFFDTILQDVVKLAPKMLTKSYENNLLETLKHKYEGICSKFGYIKHNSIELKKVNVGKVELSTFHGYVLFNVEFSAKICNPAIGSVIKCVVKNTNSFGILCTSGIYDNNKYYNVLNVVVPKLNESENIDMLNKINIDEEVNIEILGKKYMLNNESIHIFGKIIDKTSTTKIDLDYAEDKAEIESIVEDINEEDDDQDLDLEEDEDEQEEVDDEVEEDEDFDDVVEDDEDNNEGSEDEYNE
jgi:DNA-directed RNA polymerase subunit E'/Rpb7